MYNISVDGICLASDRSQLGMERIYKYYMASAFKSAGLLRERSQQGARVIVIRVAQYPVQTDRNTAWNTSAAKTDGYVFRRAPRTFLGDPDGVESTGSYLSSQNAEMKILKALVMLCACTSQIRPSGEICSVGSQCRGAKDGRPLFGASLNGFVVKSRFFLTGILNFWLMSAQGVRREAS